MRSIMGPRTHIGRRVLPTLFAIGLLAAVATPSSAGADQLSDKQAEAQQVATKLDQLESRVMSLNADAETAKANLARANAAVDDAQQRVDEANSELDRHRSELQRYAVQAYVSGADNPAVDAMLTSTGDVAPQRRGYIEVASGNRQDLLDEVEHTKQRAQEEGERLAEAQANAEARTGEIQQSLDQAQAATDEQQRIKAKIDSDVATLVAQDLQRKAEEAQAAAAAQARQQAAQDAAARAAAASTRSADPVGRAAPAPSSKAVPIDPGPPPPVGSGASGAVAAAMSRIGMPYIWAASGPSSFDCSGLTMWAWAQVGLSLPHYSGAQYAMSRPVSPDAAQPGDLVFFWGPGSGGDPGHVGMYIGGGMMVHAPGTGRTVTTNSIYYWPGARVAIGRVG